MAVLLGSAGTGSIEAAAAPGGESASAASRYAWAAAAPAATAPSQSSSRASALELERLAEALYRYASEGDINKARDTAAAAAELFTASSFGGLTSVEGINALSGTIIDMKAAIAGVNLQPEEWKSAAARFRLAANSLAHPSQPMWQQYYKLMLEDMRTLEQSGNNSDQTAWKSAVSRIAEKYEMIRPAVIIAKGPVEVNRFDAWLSYAAGLASASPAPSRAEFGSAVSHGKEALRALFGREKDEPTLSVPLGPREYGPAGWIGAGFILAALAYTGFRKYRGEKSLWKPF